MASITLLTNSFDLKVMSRCMPNNNSRIIPEHQRKIFEILRMLCGNG